MKIHINDPGCEYVYQPLCNCDPDGNIYWELQFDRDQNMLDLEALHESPLMKEPLHEDGRPNEININLKSKCICQNCANIYKARKIKERENN